jgi:hypothetical protein
VQDFLYLLLLVGLVGLTALFVIFCDHLIGSDEEALRHESEHIDEIDDAEMDALEEIKV